MLKIEGPSTTAFHAYARGEGGMKAMVLAAGLGTRLRPLTETWPKPAMPFLGQPLIRYTFAVLQRAGIRSVGLNTHHLPEVMERTARAEAEKLGMTSTFVHEPIIQGTGGGIRGLKDFLRDEEVFVVFNGDILFTVELEALIAEHRASNAAATLLLLPMPEGEKYAAVETSAAGHVRRIAGHGPGGDGLKPWHFTGVHLMSPVVFDFMRPGVVEDINREVYPRMMEKGLVVRGALANGYWSDLGTPARYLATQADVLFKRASLSGLGAASPFSGSAVREGAGGWTAISATVEGSVSGPVFVDANAHVKSGARVDSASYVGAKASIGSRATVRSAAVLADTNISDGETVEQVIAWADKRMR